MAEGVRKRRNKKKRKKLKLAKSIECASVSAVNHQSLVGWCFNVCIAHIYDGEISIGRIECNFKLTSWQLISHTVFYYLWASGSTCFYHTVCVVNEY